MSQQEPPYHSAMTHYIFSRPPPAGCSNDATAWGEWGSAHGKGSQQLEYLKSLQEITRIRQAHCMVSDAEVYRPHSPYFPTTTQAKPIQQHQGHCLRYGWP